MIKCNFVKNLIHFLVDIMCRWKQRILMSLEVKNDVLNYAACFASCLGVNQVDGLPPALIGFSSVERVNVKFDVFF